MGPTDTKAKKYAKAQKADKIVKESREVVIKDDAGNKTSVIENDYYAVNLERKHGMHLTSKRRQVHLSI